MAAFATPSESEPEVRTAAGVLRGGWESGLAVFRGIPFGRRSAFRGAAAGARLGWGATRRRLRYAAPAVHCARGFQDTAGGDWLTLNVWTPEPDPGSGLPVMVWIPGGGYAMGNSGLPEYDAGHLAATGTVVVTLSYRLGVEGFAQIRGAPANRGLLDQIAALEWVRDNIEVFGGDPDR